jgi:hypothetical protein
MKAASQVESNTNLAVDYSAYGDPRLEKIYALENVDIRSVRKIEFNPHQHNPEHNAEFIDDGLLDSESQESQQSEFDFVHSESIRLEPFILREPIQVLGLSRRIEALLIAQQKRFIKDLLAKDRHSLAAISGLGFGHLDEVQNRLQAHIKGHDVNKVRRIDFMSWARTLVGDLEPKKLFVALETFELTELVNLTMAENVEVRRATAQARRMWTEEIISELRSPEKQALFFDDLKKCTAKFIIPWLKNRQGIASETELLERFSLLGHSASDTDKVIKLMKMLYSQDQFLLAPFLVSIDEQAYSDSRETAAEVSIIIETAKSYFYKGDLRYTLKSLENWITRECARNWIGFREGFIERALRKCSVFRVRRGACGNLFIKLS